MVSMYDDESPRATTYTSALLGDGICRSDVARSTTLSGFDGVCQPSVTTTMTFGASWRSPPAGVKTVLDSIDIEAWMFDFEPSFAKLSAF